MSGIKQEMKRGVFWTALDKYSNFFISLVISMILARLITPHEFGVVATATVLLAFLSMMSNFGIGPAVIQRKDLDNNDLNNIFTFTFLLGIVLGSISFFSSWFIADIYDNPELKSIIQVLSFGLFLTCINVVPAALMSKNLRFKEMATRSVAFNLFFGIIGVIAAFLGAGVYALILPSILSSVCTFFYNNYFYTVKLNKRFSLEPIKRIFSYSVYVLLTNFGNYLGRNLDKLIIGKTLSATALGYYDKAYRLLQMPTTYISAVITPVMQPIMSTLQDDMSQMAQTYARILKFIASLAFPIAVILYFSAQEIIVILFGETWTPAVSPFKILCLSIPFVMMSYPNGPVYMSCNATKQMFYLTIIGYPVFFLLYGYAAFVSKTVESIAWAYTLNEIVGIFISYYVLFVKIMHVSLLSIVKSVNMPLLFSTILIGIYLLYNNFVPLNLYPILHLFLKFSLGGILLLVFLKITNQFDAVSFVKEIIK